ncbi:helix-turn-helix domain-containing protein [Streptomyces sp. WAC05374]|uniref:helix-turn-helix domain-containing protein n=1 Tax=Streptomyces sp. WAC05374 TaxID=2487420 RepID=UPI000F872468|nr:pyridoxamine 5'-phosphate oxidase family protein [Streptomyces sp. WAC05374]RST16163.1 helix-turn-helix domain-containing protein [Streptomyces sp. WAC05374]TDF45999.1 helix-turn-helix domain-containing protein [Streptomyces sp. WAC05374]TDF52993.1 helix-turn-helix domain-containing protein [Streptomyces sp. WAC05374]TDF58207.1 helix-turn-helix domain-containing protein [Streptomyces sp. WAC05374]
MPDKSLLAEPGGGTHAHGSCRGDIGRRVAARRQQLGLSREEVAVRAGSAPGYIQYLEEQPATPGIGFLLRLADALETSVVELTGGTADLPPGTGHAPLHPELVDLGLDECRTLLGTHGVGHVAVTTREGPAILPVSYLVEDGEVAFRVAPEALAPLTGGGRMAFEVDHIDDALCRGWSVLVVGTPHTVTDPEDVHRLDDQAYGTPWGEGDRACWVALTPDRVSGRRIDVPYAHA